MAKSFSDVRHQVWQVSRHLPDLPTSCQTLDFLWKNLSVTLVFILIRNKHVLFEILTWLIIFIFPGEITRQQSTVYNEPHFIDLLFNRAWLYLYFYWWTLQTTLHLSNRNKFSVEVFDEDTIEFLPLFTIRIVSCVRFTRFWVWSTLRILNSGPFEDLCCLRDTIPMADSRSGNRY